MFELFVALFGLAYWGTKIAGDKAGLKAADRRYANTKLWYESRRDAWLSKVYRYDDFAGVREFVYDHTLGQVAEMLREVYSQLPSYKDIFDGNPWLNYFGARMGKNAQHISYQDKEPERCIDWLLAKKGRIRQHIYTDDGVSFPYGGTARQKLAWDRQYEFWMRILQEIRKVAPESRLIYTQDLEGPRFDKVAYDAEKDLDKFRHKAGRICWLYLTHYDDNLQYR